MQSNATADRMIALYPADAFPSTFERAKIAYGDIILTCQYVPASPLTRRISRRADIFLRRDWFIAQKLQSAGIENVYNYRWNTPDPVANALAPWKGVLHTSDLFFLFNGTKCVAFPPIAAQVLI